MGQRSQIYVCVKANEKLKKMWNKEYSLTALYFQWNYGTRMVSRAVSIIHVLKELMEYSYIFQNESDYKKRIQKVANINFDMRASDVESSDIAKEIWSCDGQKEDLFGQDNNNGYVYIYLDLETKKIKYAFSTTDNEIVTSLDYIVKDSYCDTMEEFFVKHKDYTYENEFELLVKNAKDLGEYEFLTEREISKLFLDYNWNVEQEIIDREKTLALYDLFTKIPSELLTEEYKMNLRKIDWLVYNKAFPFKED